MESTARLKEKSFWDTYKQEETAYFLSLPRGISRLEKLGESVFYPKNHVIIEPGQFTNYCYVLKKGRVVSYESRINGEESIYHFYEKNSLILESDLLFHRQTPVGFRTVAASELLRINRSTLLNAVKADPQLALDIIESVSVKSYCSIQQVRHERNHSALWKVCDFLLSSAEQYGVHCENKILIREKISQQMISNTLGVNRITVVRIIKQLRELGLIEQRSGFYWVCDVEGLMEYQQGLDLNA